MRVSTAEADCASEPIRVPGSIQPFGWMAILDAEHGHLVAHSANWPGQAAFDLVLPGLRSAIGNLQQHATPQPLGVARAGDLGWTCVAHQSGALAMLEFEPLAPGCDEDGHALRTVVDTFAPRLQAAQTVEALCTLAVSQLKELTGFGRCLAYRFDSDGHGEVLAELADPGYESYLGHRFPASDIPAQARDLYRINQFRLICDADAVPVPLHCVDAAWTAQKLDLSMADLRSISPVHIQYMRNMRTPASMSVSIVVAGKLWGMVSCHHRTPLSLALAKRNACRHLGRLVSMQVEVLQSRADLAERLGSRKMAFQVLSGLGRSDATLRQLLQTPEPLLRLVDATGVAVVHDDECWSAGLVPEQVHILALAQLVSATRTHTFRVDRLVNTYAMAPTFATVAAGVLAISISKVRRHVVLWFRPELVETIRWAGDPNEKSREPGGGISPRRSFTTWKQEVRGQCRRWSATDLASATELRHALITLVLARAQERELLTYDLSRANRDIDNFIQSVSHELRQPLITAGSFGQLAKDHLEAAGDVRGVHYIDRVLKAVAQTSAVSDSVLELARISRAPLEPRSVDISAMAGEALASLKRRDPSRHVVTHVQPGMTAVTDEPLIKLVLVQLLDNAWKFSSPRNPASISVGSDDVRGKTQWWVKDDGVGFDATSAHRILQPFHRFHASSEFGGIGAGLALVNAAITKLGGTVRVEAVEGAGATVYFSLGSSAQAPASQDWPAARP